MPNVTIGVSTKLNGRVHKLEEIVEKQRKEIERLNTLLEEVSSELKSKKTSKVLRQNLKSTSSVNYKLVQKNSS